MRANDAASGDAGVHALKAPTVIETTMPLTTSFLIDLHIGEDHTSAARRR
jgi:hypothetical protein